MDIYGFDLFARVERRRGPRGRSLVVLGPSSAENLPKIRKIRKPWISHLGKPWSSHLKRPPRRALRRRNCRSRPQPQSELAQSCADTARLPAVLPQRMRPTPPAKTEHTFQFKGALVRDSPWSLTSQMDCRSNSIEPGPTVYHHKANCSAI